MTISYRSLLDALNVEALRVSPDGSVFSGYEVLKGKKVRYGSEDGREIFIIPLLLGELQLNLSIERAGAVERFVENVREDIELP